jgi:hypothetical protein
MPDYVQTRRSRAPQTAAATAATEYSTASGVIAGNREPTHRGGLADALNRSPRAQALLQMRQAFDEGPRVQSQLALQRALNRHDSAPAQSKPNATGLPDRLKAGVEQLSGLAMDDVRVHTNSPKPAAVQAHAYAQGTDIHLAPGQEQHLPHEAWHVVQQKQGRVKPTLQMKGVAINGDAGLVVQRLIDSEQNPVTAERIEQEKVVHTLLTWQTLPDESPDMEQTNKALRAKITARLATLDPELKAAQEEKTRIGKLDAQTGGQPQYKSVGYDNMAVGNARDKDILLTSGLANCIAVVAWDRGAGKAVMGHYNTSASSMGAKPPQEIEALQKLKVDLLRALASTATDVEFRVGLGTMWDSGASIEKNKKMKGVTMVDVRPQQAQLEASIETVFEVRSIGMGSTMTFEPGTGVLSVVVGEDAKKLVAQWNDKGGTEDDWEVDWPQSSGS